MSSDSRAAFSRRALLLVSIGLLAVTAGCQVRPLYSEASGTRARLAAVGFSEAKDRIGQEVRNRLIFLAAGGKGEASNPEYMVELTVKSESSDVLYQPSAKVSTSGQYSETGSAGRVTVSADYTLKKVSDGSVLRFSHRQAVALVDFPTQEFAKIRAIRDAENRAARELAELIIADLAGILGR